MRGKLRDKRAPKRDVFKRETVDRKRSAKHNTRVAPWLDQEFDEQEDELLDELSEEDVEDAPKETVITLLPQLQPQNK